MTLGPCVNYNPNGGGDWCAYAGAVCGNGTISYTNNSDGSVTFSGGTQSWGGGQLASRKVFGKGFYAEATFSWTGPGATSGGVSFWGYGSDGTMTSGGNWNADTSVCSLGCASASIELDIIETITGGTNSYQATMHHWGPSACCNVQDVQQFNADQSSPHRYGMLWIPATPGNQGSMQWYLDGSPAGNPYTWNYGDTGGFGDIDSEYPIMFLGSDNSHAERVYNVQVWQASSNNALCCATGSP